MMRRAVFVGNSESVFMSRSRDALSERGLIVDIFDPYDLRYDTRPFCLPRVVQRFLKARRELPTLCGDSTAMLHMLSPDAAWLLPMLKKRFRKVVAIAYGSDILRRDRSRDWLLSRGLRNLDAIMATNDNVLQAAVTDFPFLAEKPCQLLRFGLPVLDALDVLPACSPEAARSQLGFPSRANLVSLGYNASEGQRQSELIDALALRANDLTHCHFVVPIQYGSSKIMESLRRRVSEANSSLGSERFTILSEFHDVKMSALMRRATDVLINHSVSDAFSGTVQEVVYAGNLVLAHSDLPYRSMPGFGSSIKTYTNLDDVVNSLSESALDSHRSDATLAYNLTREALRETSSWDAVFNDWVKAIEV
ncbi:hypothetical protein [Ancylobacter polymorphus]|uniref:Glycosyltransferase family 1 protein n=1 Tax=Ancylobacter polymorphus TaxID=223390 RepID=A0ABU0BGT8_9HYPH|nr:hypothetical protein [Ancylobacter polymorphus]MDQ0304645.1 hypothetical protein [Ancylobacter polymorphus]